MPRSESRSSGRIGLGQFTQNGVAPHYGNNVDMPRALRIHYPGAVYHVMNCGDRREPAESTAATT
jgi:hypothetical protein